MSIANITPPTNPMTAIKLLKPSKYKIKGTKQVINQAKFFFIFKSYQKTFFKVKPKVRNEVKVVTKPNKRARETIPSPKYCLSPTKADCVVCSPVIPKIK